jgi:hypothetical protein
VIELLEDEQHRGAAAAQAAKGQPQQSRVVVGERGADEGRVVGVTQALAVDEHGLHQLAQERSLDPQRRKQGDRKTVKKSSQGELFIAGPRP